MRTNLMFRLFIIAFAVFTWTFLSLTGNALSFEKMMNPKVDYSADMLMETDNNMIKLKVYHASGGKERQEMNLEGTSQVIILRQDKMLSWVLMPEQKMYMEMNLNEAKKNMEKNKETKDFRDIRDCQIDQKAMGNESVNGVTATKQKISMSCPDKSNYEGYMWVTKDYIMVKMDAVAGNNGSKTRIKIDLKNLKVAKQSASLFEIPAGYQKFSMGEGLGSMLKGMTPPDSSRQENIETSDQGSTGREYTSKSKARKGREYTSQTTKEESDNSSKPVQQMGDLIDTANKLKGLFGK